MKVTRLYTGPDSESHFEDVEITLKDTGHINLRQSELMKATSIFSGGNEALLNKLSLGLIA